MCFTDCVRYCVPQCVGSQVLHSLLLILRMLHRRCLRLFSISTYTIHVDRQTFPFSLSVSVLLQAAVMKCARCFRCGFSDLLKVTFVVVFDRVWGILYGLGCGDVSDREVHQVGCGCGGKGGVVRAMAVIKIDILIDIFIPITSSCSS